MVGDQQVRAVEGKGVDILRLRYGKDVGANVRLGGTLMENVSATLGQSILHWDIITGILHILAEDK
jgi:hypothetical protein